MQANLVLCSEYSDISHRRACCLRFLLQLAQANFYNQSTRREPFTAPLTAPFNSLPTVGPFNTGL